jgi:hypothetical protein
MLQHGTDQEAVDAAITGMAWARAGHNAVVTHDVHLVLERPATWVRDHQDAFRPTPQVPSRRHIRRREDRASKVRNV